MHEMNLAGSVLQLVEAAARRDGFRRVAMLRLEATPPSALVIRQAAREGLGNFSLLCNHVLTPAAITHILQSPEVADPQRFVQMRTAVGGQRIVDWLSGEPLPRIC